eukprot:scaffold98_cov307-Prasinococcus_capsulatus_cf.AAC.18
MVCVREVPQAAASAAPTAPAHSLLLAYVGDDGPKVRREVEQGPRHRLRGGQTEEELLLREPVGAGTSAGEPRVPRVARPRGQGLP